MAITTIKLNKTTRNALKENKNLKGELIEAYKNSGKVNLKILNEWENTSKEID